MALEGYIPLNRVKNTGGGVGRGCAKDVRTNRRLSGFMACRVFFRIVTQSASGQSWSTCLSCICQSSVFMLNIVLQRTEVGTYIVDVLSIHGTLVEEVESDEVNALFLDGLWAFFVPKLYI